MFGVHQYVLTCIGLSVSRITQKLVGGLIWIGFQSHGFIYLFFFLNIVRQGKDQQVSFFF